MLRPRRSEWASSSSKEYVEGSRPSRSKAASTPTPSCGRRIRNSYYTTSVSSFWRGWRLLPTQRGVHRSYPSKTNTICPIPRPKPPYSISRMSITSRRCFCYNSILQHSWIDGSSAAPHRRSLPTGCILSRAQLAAVNWLKVIILSKSIYPTQNKRNNHM